jgi:glutamate-ammonia-ligase adenylyltransferase
MLTDLLIRHPEHFERLFSTRAAMTAADHAGWRRRLRRERATAPDSAALARRLESLRTREMLAAGLAWAVGERTLEQTMGDLARLARDILTCFLGRHLADALDPPATGVLALGTLAAGSMSFASDADLLFVHTTGAGPLVQPLASRAGGLLSPPGGPYQVDMRLRPEGRNAPTSVDVDYLQAYLTERASAWEALAMARARPLYGRRRVLGPAIDVLEEWLGSFRLDEDARRTLREVRRSQEEELSAGGRSPIEAFDVKRSPGAMADVEFIALGLSLDDWQRGTPRSAHIHDLLDGLARSGRLDAEEVQLLKTFYRRCRAAQVGLQLHYGRDVTRFPDEWGEVEPSAPLAKESAAALRREAHAVRTLFDREFPTPV